MPGPTTEVLNDDVRDLRGDLRRVETAVTTDLRRIETSMIVELGKVDKHLGELAAEFGLFKWMLGLTMVAAFSGVVSSAYWAGSLASRVAVLETRADKTDSRLDRIESRLNSIDSRLERIEATLTKAVGRAEGENAKPGEKR